MVYQRIPGGSSGGGVTLPIGQSDVTGLTAALAGKQTKNTEPFYTPTLLKSGEYGGPLYRGVSTNMTSVNEQARIIPMLVQGSYSITHMGFAVVTSSDANGVLRGAIYADDGTGLRPGALLGETSGTITAVGAGTKELALASPLSVANQVIWLAQGVQAATTTPPVMVGKSNPPPLPLTGVNILTSVTTPHTYYQLTMTAGQNFASLNAGTASAAISAGATWPQIAVKAA